MHNKPLGTGQHLSDDRLCHLRWGEHVEEEGRCLEEGSKRKEKLFSTLPSKQF